MFQHRMEPVFFREDRIASRHAPIDAQSGIVEGNAGFALRSVKIVALVRKDGLRAQYGKSVRKTAGDEQLQVIFVREFHCHVSVSYTDLTLPPRGLV